MAGDDEPRSIRAIARITGASPSHVHRVLKRKAPNYQPDADGMIAVSYRVGLDGKVRPSRQFDTRERDTRIRKLRKARLSVRAIAAEVGCSVGTVHRVISKGK